MNLSLRSSNTNKVVSSFSRVERKRAVEVYSFVILLLVMRRHQTDCIQAMHMQVDSLVCYRLVTFGVRLMFRAVRTSRKHASSPPLFKLPFPSLRLLSKFHRYYELVRPPLPHHLLLGFPGLVAELPTYLEVSRLISLDVLA